MSLRKEFIEVNTDDRFVFRNRNSIEVSQTTDRVKKMNPVAGTAELIERIAAEEFANSCVCWPLKEELNHDNAVNFYLQFRNFAVKQVNEAKSKINEIVNNDLKNLLTGHIGGSNPVE
jgi:tRNA isopentenyl-2-thiomethyl-A-37 hydroxylase MiaE